MLKRRLDLWLPTYVATAPLRFYRKLARRRKLTHVMFLICDHFEPLHAAQDEQQVASRLATWQVEYAHFQQRCRDNFGHAPLHTWFYPPHHGEDTLPELANMVFDGLGEVELHYHHDGDTEATLRQDLESTLAQYGRWGILTEAGQQPKTSFGFVHGDWALGNSGAGKYCGVNNELTLLQELGCWADFTMPSADLCQTRKINSIYYAEGDPHKPKSHDWGSNAAVGKSDQRGLLLIQGPLGINWCAPGYPRIENASLTSANWGRLDRIRKWLDCQVHVTGRPEWVFIKLHTHGAIERDFDALFGEKALEMHRLLNQQLNDGKQFKLHYVTARQAFNVIKAAEEGMEGDPSDWFDYVVRPPVNYFYVINAPHRIKHCTSVLLTIADIEANGPVSIRTRVGPVEEITGAIKAVEIKDGASEIHLQTASMEEAIVTLRAKPDFVVEQIRGGNVVSDIPDANGFHLLTLSMTAECTIKYNEAAA